MADASQITVDGVTYDIKDAVARNALENKILTLTVGAFSSLPQTISNSKITADMVVLSIAFGVPTAITSDVGWATSAGQLMLTGSISGTTTAVITLGKSSY